MCIMVQQYVDLLKGLGLQLGSRWSCRQHFWQYLLVICKSFVYPEFDISMFIMLVNTTSHVHH